MTNVHLYPSTLFFVQDIFYVSSRAANGDGDEAAAIKIQTIYSNGNLGYILNSGDKVYDVAWRKTSDTYSTKNICYS